MRVFNASVKLFETCDKSWKVLFQWQPEQPKKLFITLSGTDRVKAVLKVINEEMEKLTAVKKIETPPIKRGLVRDFINDEPKGLIIKIMHHEEFKLEITNKDLNPYVQMAAGQIVEYDFQKVPLKINLKLTLSSDFVPSENSVPRYKNYANWSVWKYALTR